MSNTTKLNERTAKGNFSIFPDTSLLKDTVPYLPILLSSKMPLLFTPISELFPSTVPYKIKVRIARLWAYEKPERPGVITGLDMILVDEKGSRIQATLSQGLCRKYQEHLEEGACRLIMNFRLIPNQGSFRGTGHPFKISFIFQSVVKPAQDIPNLDHRFHFHPFDEIVSESHDSTVFFDVIGEVVAMSEIQDVRIGARTESMLRIKLRDLGDEVIDCTLWSKFAFETQAYVKSHMDNPVVFLGSLMKTRKFNGKTTIQSNPFATKLYFRSEMDEIRQFKEGLGSSGSMVSLSQLTSSTTSSQSSLGPFPRTSYKHIAQILAETEDMLCVTLATIVSFNVEEPWFYVACNGCLRKATPYFNAITEEEEKDKHSCGHCDKEITTTSLRFMVKFTAADQTETATFLLFDREVVELIHKSVYDIRQHQIEFNRQADYPEELLGIEGMTVVLKVKVKGSEHGYGNSCFQVVKLSVDGSEIKKMREEADKQDATLDQNPVAISITSGPSAANVIQDPMVNQTVAASATSDVPADTNAIEIGNNSNNSSESSDHDVIADPFIPSQKRPLSVVLEDDSGQHSSTKRTPQSVNKPKKVFVKREKKH